MSKTEIAENVWDEAFDGDLNIVEVYVGNLRKKVDAPFDRRAIADGARRRLSARPRWRLSRVRRRGAPASRARTVRGGLRGVDGVAGDRRVPARRGDARPPDRGRRRRRRDAGRGRRGAPAAGAGSRRAWPYRTTTTRSSRSSTATARSSSRRQRIDDRSAIVGFRPRAGETEIRDGHPAPDPRERPHRRSGWSRTRRSDPTGAATVYVGHGSRGGARSRGRSSRVSS